MKGYFIFIILIICTNCQQFKTEENLDYIQCEGIKIKEITNFNKSYISKGSYKKGNDTVISKYEIESKYSLLVIKLKNVAKNYKLNVHSNTLPTSPGFFRVIGASDVYDVKFTPSVYKNDYKINEIDFTSNTQINSPINNDTIKSLNLNFSEFQLKINKQEDNLIATSRIVYYDIENLSANFLFYTIKNETYLFILTPIKGKGVIENNTLYNYLFTAN